MGGWERVDGRISSSSDMPCSRSLHAAAVWKDFILVFGGYDGTNRVNDFYSYSVVNNKWSKLDNANAPPPRDRHVAAVHGSSFYIFGGFDGATRVNGMVW
jgi:leucine-zipper-like transcriptional regulator 1